MHAGFIGALLIFLGCNSICTQILPDVYPDREGMNDLMRIILDENNFCVYVNVSGLCNVDFDFACSALKCSFRLLRNFIYFILRIGR